jgi:hypothetical protein
VTFLDVDAPNTNWRPASEDPIPFLFGRLPAGGFVYRFLTGRPLDGHARTDATFWHPGTKALTRSGRTMPYQYWPGWKRGLLVTRLPAFGLVPYTVVAGANEALLDFGPWWAQWQGPSLAWTPLVTYASVQGVRYARGFQHERHYLRPIRAAVIATIRTRDSVRVDIPRGLVHAKDAAATGRIYLPTGWSGSEGDRENLLLAVQERLTAPEIDARFNMEGVRPHMELYVPPQPPKLVSWEEMLERADSVSPFLGTSAAGAVSWDLGDDSPHIGIVGGSGSGKSELMAWVVAQFMRGGAGVVVLDPKGTSHRWLMSIPEVLYCGTPAMLHDTIMWLDSEMDRRAAANLAAPADIAWPRLVVVLEERNSLQDKLRDHWADVRGPGMPQMSPAVRALDRLASMGRSLGITVVLAAQETAQAAIGKKGNYGAWAIAGRLQQNHWKNIMGAGARKPAISVKPGRFGYVVAGQATVFQGAYPDVKAHGGRLAAWASGGDSLLDVKALMQQQETAPFPSSAPVTADQRTEEYVTLSQFAASTGKDLVWLRSRRDRDRAGFPAEVGKGAKNASLYVLDSLSAWLDVQDASE